MEINLNLSKLDGMNVYEYQKSEPCGKIVGCCFSGENGNVSSLIVETLSLIPVKKNITLNKIRKVTNDKIEINCELSDKNNYRVNDIRYNDIVGVNRANKTAKKIKDISFDCETGVITDIVVKQNILKKSEIFHVNKITIKDNTIYIE